MSDATVLTVFPTDSTPATGTSASSLEILIDRLTGAQRDALNALINGQAIKIAARVARVHRGTVHRWINRDPFFRAAYNTWQDESRETARAKLVSLTHDALNAVAKAVRAGDRHIAYKLLKDLGHIAKLQPGDTDPEVVRQQLEIDKAEQQRDLDAQLQRAQDQPDPPVSALPIQPPESA